MFKEIVGKIVGGIFLLLAVWFLLSKIFPDKLDVAPVLEKSKSILKDVKNILGGVITDADISDDVLIIDDVPVVKLQSSGQRANKNIGEPIKELGNLDSISKPIEQNRYQIRQESESDNSQSKNIGFSGPSTLDYCGYDSYKSKMEITPGLNLVCEMDDLGLPMKWIEINE